MALYQSNSAQPTTARSAVLDRAWEFGGLPVMNGMTSAEWKRWARSAAGARSMSADRLHAAQIIAALGGRWSDSQQSGMARCVAHDERTASLRISERNGRTLFHCFAGCEQSAVLEALRARGLWSAGPDRKAQRLTPPPRPKDSRELRWLVDDIQLLDPTPEAPPVWEFLRHAAELSPFALECVSRVLRKERPSCRRLVRQWVDKFMEPVAAPDMEQAA